MAKVKVTINGKEIYTDSSKTILEVVRENNLDDIPTLCYDPKLPSYGSCFLCVVEVEGIDRLIPSCCSPVNNNMVIHTDNKKIRSARKSALELLLSNHYADCLGPCKQTCPAGVDVQGYIALIAEGKYNEAVRLIKETNPLPIVCGRVCVRPCEDECRRNMVDDRVGIDYLKRYTADKDIQKPWTPKVPTKNGKKVAVVGGGPAGLTCAYFLILKGYSVTVFEKLPNLGGMLRYGIPEYRLPKETLDKEIKWITDLGVEVKTNKAIGRDFSIDSLKEDGFDSIFLAMGAQAGNIMRVPEEETTEGVIKGVDFLRDIQLKGDPCIYGKIVVVGGGNTAIDAARTSLRYGADEVIILYRRTRKEMPAHEMEIEAAIEEGVDIQYLATPTKIVKDNGRLKALECIRMKLGEPDKSGRRRPIPIEGSEFTLECDFAISAIGQVVDLDGLEKDERLAVTRWNSIEVDENTFETSIPGVFSGGDVVTGPAVAIDAIAHGKKAAESIDEYLKTGKVTSKNNEFISKKERFGELPESEFEDYPKIEKNKMPELDPKERIKSLDEVELGFTDEQALDETFRCLECGCLDVFECELKKYADEYNIDISRFLGEVRKYKIDNNHPFIILDPNKCISCGRCVRTCAEILIVSALGFVYRGFKSIVRPSMEKKLLETNCVSCGNCIAACPTGAIMEKFPFRKPGPWKTDRKESICSFCSVGCNLNFDIVTDNIFYAVNGNDETHNKGYLCVKGKFGPRYLHDNDRLIKPLIRKNNELKESSWDDAFEFTAEKLRKVISTYGSDSVAVFGSPKMTNEELYLLQKFARAGLKTNNIDSINNLLNGIELDALDEAFGITTSTATMDDFQKADVIIVLNADLSEENLIMELKIKDAAKKGARLVMINSTEVKLTKFSNLWVDSRKGTNTVLLNGIMNNLIKNKNIDTDFINNRTKDFDKFKKTISDLKDDEVSQVTGINKDKFNELVRMLGDKDSNVVLVYNIDSHIEKSKNDLKAIGNLLMLTGKIGKSGNGLIVLRDFANSAGLLDMGVSPKYLPGYIKEGESEKINSLSRKWNTDLKKIFKNSDIMKKIRNDEIKAMLIFGEDPLIEAANLTAFTGVEFKLVSDNFMTLTARAADVVLPASTYIETNGSFTSCDRRVQKINKIFEPKAGLENQQIINKIAEKMNIDTGLKSTDEIMNEIKEIIPLYSNVDFDGIWGNNIFEEKFLTKDGKGKFVIYETDISTIKPEKQIYLSSEEFFRDKIKRGLEK